METFRPQDSYAEQQLGKFMDEYFYSRIKANDKSPIRFQRITDREEQFQGKDVIIETNNVQIVIDEKASIYYSNTMLPTFAFEIDSIQKEYSKPIEGWFVNDSLCTDYYMLIWPNVKCNKIEDENKKALWVRKELSQLSKNDFTIVEAMMISKKAIRNLLEQKGFDKMRLLEYARKYREIVGNRKTKEDRMLVESIKLSFSGNLAEKPINIVIPKEILKGLAKGIYLISPDGYANIKEKA